MDYFKKILAPTDLSESSRLGLHYAFSIAEQSNAELIIVHVASKMAAWQAVSDDMGFINPDAYMWTVDRIVSEAALDLNHFLESHLEEFCRHQKVRKKVLLGRVVERILDVARKENVDLIVMSPRVHGTFKRLILGSATDKVVFKAPCPVLSVCEPLRRGPKPGKQIPLIGGVLQTSET